MSSLELFKASVLQAKACSYPMHQLHLPPLQNSCPDLLMKRETQNGASALEASQASPLCPTPTPSVCQEFSNGRSQSPPWRSGKESACQCRRCGFNAWIGKIPLAGGMATHSSFLAWEFLWTEEPGRLQSVGSDIAEHMCTHTPAEDHTRV